MYFFLRFNYVPVEDSNLLIVIIRVSSINVIYNIRRVWRYQNGIEEGQTTQWPKEKDRQNNDQKKKTEEHTKQWPKEKGQKDKQRSTKHYT